MKKKLNKKNVIILIAILILFIILIVISFAKSYLEKNESTPEHENYGYDTMPAQNPTEEYVSEKTIKYSNLGVLTDLKGELPTSTVVKIVREVFVEEIPQILEKVEGYNQTQLKDYYNKNTEDILNNCRIATEQDFISMITTFSALTSDLTEDFSTCEFTKDEALGLKFSYENGESVECKIIGENSNLITFEF